MSCRTSERVQHDRPVFDCRIHVFRIAARHWRFGQQLAGRNGTVIERRHVTDERFRLGTYRHEILLNSLTRLFHQCGIQVKVVLRSHLDPVLQLLSLHLGLSPCHPCLTFQLVVRRCEPLREELACLGERAISHTAKIFGLVLLERILEILAAPHRCNCQVHQLALALHVARDELVRIIVVGDRSIAHRSVLPGTLHPFQGISVGLDRFHTQVIVHQSGLLIHHMLQRQTASLASDHRILVSRMVLIQSGKHVRVVLQIFRPRFIAYPAHRKPCRSDPVFRLHRYEAARSLV